MIGDAADIPEDWYHCDDGSNDGASKHCVNEWIDERRDEGDGNAVDH